MEFAAEVLAKLLEGKEAAVTFPQLEAPMERLIEGRAMRALKEIRDILADESLSDTNCFYKIEKIVTVFEKLGADCGNRHDFG